MNFTQRVAFLSIGLAVFASTGYAYSESVTSSVTIGTTCGMQFVPTDAVISYGEILPGDTTAEQKFTVIVQLIN